MSFWGPSNAQNQAQGWFPAQGDWNTQQYRDWLNQANTQANAGQNNAELGGHLLPEPCH
jgi:hypothetical protein